jgi:type II secretory pathway component PulM
MSLFDNAKQEFSGLFEGMSSRLHGGNSARLFPLALLLWAIVAACVWVYLKDGNEAAEKRITALQNKINEVKPLVSETIMLEARRKDLSEMSTLAAARQVTRELKLDGKLSAIRPGTVGQDREGVQMIFEGLNHPEVVNLLKNLENRGGLKIISAGLTRRPDNSNSADFQTLLLR